MPNKTSPVLKWALILGLIIVLNLFFNFGIKAFYPAPNFQDFCPQKQVTLVPTSSAACVSQGGSWTENGPQTKVAIPPAPGASSVSAPTAYCDLNYTCSQNFQNTNSLYDRNVFIILVVLGLISLGLGFYATTGAVSLGLSLGGVLSFIIASIRYWSDMRSYLQFIILGLALAILIWLGLKKLSE